MTKLLSQPSRAVILAFSVYAKSTVDYIHVENLKTHAIHVHVFFRSWYHLSQSTE